MRRSPAQKDELIRMAITSLPREIPFTVFEAERLFRNLLSDFDKKAHWMLISQEFVDEYRAAIVARADSEPGSKG